MTQHATPAVLDLGELDGVLLAFGGVDGNLDALEALLKVAAEQGIPFTRLVHTGSVAPFCAEPAACATRLAELGIAAVKGAFEVDAPQLVRGDTDGLSDALAPGWRRLIDDGLPNEVVRWMEALPSEIVFTYGGHSFRIVHGGVTSMEKLLFWSSPGPAFDAELELSGTDVVIAGRSGFPFTRLFPRPSGRERAWHNPGSLGLPPNDGTPRLWMSLIRASRSGLSFEHLPLAYDYRRAASRLRRLCGDEDFARSLETGLWPSLEEVPQGERRRRGKPFEPQTISLGTTDDLQARGQAGDALMRRQ
ncbi:metallophosphoesterase family protein [Rhodoligotrophos defluvii]|uniref:metallophosphoesterase family protein n=1 Tax=Rhodoligotrophos defluvii TaxID=2561934 RepID=UPI0010C99841|nr:metallophosphoesterase family protein [Rhodoligotrophos defluvii]